MCGSTCFGRYLAHHQELTTALAASGFMMMHGLTNIKFDHFLNTIKRLDFGMATLFKVRQEIDF